MTESIDRQTVQRRIEVIIARQLAGYLAVPMMIVDPWGTVVFYNELAERVLGRRFDEDGPVAPEDWGGVFDFTDESGVPIPVMDTPLVAALRTRKPITVPFWMKSIDGIRRHLIGIGIPLLAEDGLLLGAMGLFWEVGG